MTDGVTATPTQHRARSVLSLRIKGNRMSEHQQSDA